MKILAGILGGLILAILGSMVVGLTFGGSKSGPGPGVWTFFIAWVVGIVVAVKAPNAGKAWRRLLLTASVFSFLLPLAGVVFTGVFMATQTNGGAEAAGAAIGGGLASGVLGFVGFFLGVVFLLIGILVGRDKQVIYVQAPAGGAMPIKPAN